MGSVNIKDLAKYCHTSVSTISRVLNDKPDVNPETRQKILEAIHALNYIPNNSARDLVLTESDRVAVIVRGRFNIFFSHMIKVIEEELAGKGFSMELRHISSMQDEIQTAAEIARSRRLCGALFLGGRFDYAPETVQVLNIPFVCITYSNTFGSLPKDAYSSVGINDKKEAKKAVEYLISHGHRRIATVISSKNDCSVSQLRFQGYLEALEDNGIPYEPSLVAETGNYYQKNTFDAVSRLINSGHTFTALFAISDMMAIASIKALFESGIRVPDDCSVIGIDGIDYSNYCIPTLTTLEQPAEKMAKESANLLIGLIKGAQTNRHLFFPAKLREGGSVKTI